MSRTLRCAVRALAVAVAGSAIGTAARALETDQYYAVTRPPLDATDVVNAKFNWEIEQELASISPRQAGELSCEQVAERIARRFRFFIFQKIELWAVNSSLIARSPATVEEELEFRRHSLYSLHGRLDIGMAIPPSPTISLAGVLVGTDKLSHFVSEGWRYHRRYQRARRRGQSHERAEHEAVRRGVRYEHAVLGLRSSGVFSRADLEANYQGMLFYRGLCDADAPALQRVAGKWCLERPLDLRDYVSPEWDESYQTSIYSRFRWRRVRSALLEYCGLLDEKNYRDRHRHYRQRDGVTPSEKLLSRLIESGKLPAPSLFTLQHNCPNASRSQPRSPVQRLPEEGR
ncbi:MAG: hypothetical protein JSV80_13625 [Acidobacteriota bacterium]|nr:MAG: hypothetical protein JSV80_13625 [Acidobacteriota bacterium]